MHARLTIMHALGGGEIHGEQIIEPTLNFVYPCNGKFWLEPVDFIPNGLHKN